MQEEISSSGFRGLFPAKVTTPHITLEKTDPFSVPHFLFCNLVTATFTLQSIQEGGSFSYKLMIKSI